jgi:hypothetical protein
MHYEKSSPFFLANETPALEYCGPLFGLGLYRDDEYDLFFKRSYLEII